MSETLSPSQPDPVVVTPPPVGTGGVLPEPGAAIAVAKSPVEPASSAVAPPAPPPPARPSMAEPLARIEDKTSRIEEKLARSEAAMQRVVDRFELASARMSEVALQSELAAVRSEVQFVARRVRSSVGPGGLAVTAVATAVLTAIVILLLLRYVPALAPR